MNQDGITIGTVSGGIVNFGGAIYIAPISVTKTTSGAGEGNQSSTTTTTSGLNASSQNTITSILDIVRRSLG